MMYADAPAGKTVKQGKQLCKKSKEGGKRFVEVK